MKYIFKILLILFCVLFAQEAMASNVTGVRWTTRNDGNPPFVRMVLDLDSPVHAEAAMDTAGKNFELTLKDTDTKDGSQYDIKSGPIDFATLSSNDGNTYLDVAFTSSVKMDDIRVFALRADSSQGKPHRIVVDLPLQASAQVKPSKSTPSASNSSSAPAKPAATPLPAISGEAKKVLKGKIICIDPGHGGTDVGAIGQLNGKDIYEKDITLSIALPLRDMLKAAGATVVMTRSTDKDVYGPFADAVQELQARCDVANKAKADAFLSIHIDSFSNKDIDGTTAYYNAKSANDLLLAQKLHEATNQYLYIPDRGVKSNDFYVNVHTNMPSVLMEMGFITNSHRLKMLTTKWGPQNIAKSLFNGFVSYFEAIQ